MKRLFKGTIGILIIISIVVSTFALSVSAAEPLKRFGRDELSEYSNGNSLLYVYDMLLDSAVNSMYSTTVNVYNRSYLIEWDDVGMIVEALIFDHPEMFWLKRRYSGTYDSSTGKMKTIKIDYYFEGSALDEAKTAVYTVADELTRGLYGKTEYEKAKILYDRLILHNSYAGEGYHQTAYGALVARKSVCAGYAQAYQLLLNKAGISGFTISGESFSPGSNSSVGHAWNVVRIDGKNYLCDSTWDDSGDTLSGIRYEFFCTSAADVSETHFTDGFFVDIMNSCVHEDGDYYGKTSVKFTKFDVDRLVEVLKNNGMTAVIYVDGDPRAFHQQVRNNLGVISDKLGSDLLGVNYNYYGSNYYYIKVNCRCSHTGVTVGYNGEYHWEKCNNCSTFTNKDIHRYSGSRNKCLSCDYTYIEAETTYTLSYNANGGSGAPSAQTGSKTYTVSYTKPERNGYIFLGWSTNAYAVSPSYYGGSSITLSSNTTLYAVWQRNSETTYSLSYNANGGSGAPSSQTGSKTYTVSYTQPERNGYTFLGWSTNAYAESPSYYGGSSITLSSNTTLYAIWQKKSIVTNDGYIIIRNNPGTKSINYGDTIRLTAETLNAPEGSDVYWYVNGTYFNKGETFTLYCNAEGVYEIKAVLVDASGNAVENSYGNEVSDSQNLNVKSSLFIIIIAFFKKLFGIDNIIVQSLVQALI